MATKRIRLPRGRPQKGDIPFLQNPRRNWVMMLRSYMAGMTQPSINMASMAVAAELFGNEVEHEGLPPGASDVVAACPPWMVARVYGPRRRIGTHGYINTAVGVKAGRIKGAAEFIRQLDRQAQREALVDQAVAKWLIFSVKGFVLASQGATADKVMAAFRHSGDPELEADAPKLIRHLAACGNNATFSLPTPAAEKCA